MASEKVLVVTKDNFKDEVAGSSQPVLVDFWAPWCSPCRMIAPIVDELAADFEGRVKVGKVNVDENREVAMDYGVMSIPTLIVFKDGKAVDRIVGFKAKNELAALLEKYI